MEHILNGDLAPLLPFTHPARILIVDASASNRRVLREILREQGHEIIDVASTSDALAVTSRQRIDLAFVDLLAPEMGGPAFCHVLGSHLSTQFVPVFLVGDIDDSENEARCIQAGAAHVLVRPLRPKVVRARVAATLRQSAVFGTIDQAEAVLISIAHSLEARDNSVGEHCERLALLGSTLGVALGLSAPDLLAIQRGGYLHDIGKIAVPDSILFKPGPLTPEEWVAMRQHTIHGEKICGGMKSLQDVLPIIRSHHERWDGSGYPDGLRGDDIPLTARIVQLADIFDALTSERSYKPAFTAERALRVLGDEARAGWRDPRLVEAFRDIYPVFRTTPDAGSNTSLQALALSLQQKQGWPLHEHAAVTSDDAPSPA